MLCRRSIDIKVFQTFAIAVVVQDRLILNRLQSGERNLQRGAGKRQHLRGVGAVSNRAYTAAPVVQDRLILNRLRSGDRNLQT